MKQFHKLFKKTKPIIGMIHFPPLIGYEGYPGMIYIKRRVIKETEMLNNAGVHAIMVENNYDIPHKEFVDKEITAEMAVLTQTVVNHTDLPVGVDVLWNDYQSALGICAATGASFVRIPAFVDDVRTDYGDMHAVAKETILLRKKLSLDSTVAVLADVQVKHSRMIDAQKPLSLSIQQAIENGADGIIITGKWTGDAPKLTDLEIGQANRRNIPVVVGSGSTKENLSKLLPLCQGVIVGSAVMSNGVVNKIKLESYLNAYNDAI